ncbi:hypothetical protein N9C16_08735 [Paracoccaceae bacterium]|nr:hypothetical protein [Paracoccaceae bacterium]
MALFHEPTPAEVTISYKLLKEDYIPIETVSHEAGSEDTISPVILEDLNFLFTDQLKSFFDSESAAGLAFSNDPTAITSNGVTWGNTTNGVVLNSSLSSISSLSQLLDSIDNGLETGAFDSLQVFDNDTEIFKLAGSKSAWEISTGEVSLKLSGDLPTSLSGLVAFAENLSNIGDFIGIREYVDYDYTQTPPLYSVTRQTPLNLSSEERSRIIEDLKAFELNSLELRNGDEVFFSTGTNDQGIFINLLGAQLTFEGSSDAISIGDTLSVLDQIQDSTIDERPLPLLSALGLSASAVSLHSDTGELLFRAEDEIESFEELNSIDKLTIIGTHNDDLIDISFAYEQSLFEATQNFHVEGYDGTDTLDYRNDYYTVDYSDHPYALQWDPNVTVDFENGLIFNSMNSMTFSGIEKVAISNGQFTDRWGSFEWSGIKSSNIFVGDDQNNTVVMKNLRNVDNSFDGGIAFDVLDLTAIDFIAELSVPEPWNPNQQSMQSSPIDREWLLQNSTLNVTTDGWMDLNFSGVVNGSFALPDTNFSDYVESVQYKSFGTYILTTQYSILGNQTKYLSMINRNTGEASTAYLNGTGGTDIQISDIYKLQVASDDNGNSFIYFNDAEDAQTGVVAEQDKFIIGSTGNFGYTGNFTLLEGEFYEEASNDLFDENGQVYFRADIDINETIAIKDVEYLTINTPSQNTETISIYEFYGMTVPQILGTDSDDILPDSLGDDEIYAGNGHDEISVGAGNDFVSAGEGDDKINISAGANLIQADGGNDTIELGGDRVFNSNYWAKNVSSSLQFSTDQMVNLDGKLRIDSVIDGGTGVDRIQLTESDDAFFLHDSFSKFHDSLTLSVDDFGNQSSARIEGIEEINGGAGDDVIDLTSVDYSMVGKNLTVYGEVGNDIIWGSDANDTIYGGDDDDIIFGGAGANILNGGTGADTFQFTLSSQNDIIEDFNADEGDILEFYNSQGNTFDIDSISVNDSGNLFTISAGSEIISIQFLGSGISTEVLTADMLIIA